MPNKSENMSRPPFTREERSAHQSDFEKLSLPERTQSVMDLAKYMEAFVIAVYSEPTNENPIAILRTNALNTDIKSLYSHIKLAKMATTTDQVQIVKKTLKYIQEKRSGAEPIVTNDLEALKKIKELAKKLQVFLQEHNLSVNVENDTVSLASEEQLAELKKVLFL